MSITLWNYFYAENKINTSHNAEYKMANTINALMKCENVKIEETKQTVLVVVMKK